MTVHCAFCDKPFEITEASYRQRTECSSSGRVYCTTRCSWAGRKARRPLTSDKPKPRLSSEWDFLQTIAKRRDERKRSKA